jgi:hypothetical protein
MSQAVFFFGGYHASQSDIDAWVRSAKTQKAGIDFFGYAWPKDANSDANSAVKTFKKSGQYAAAVRDVQRNGSDTIYVVGHSSGCAIATAVDAGLTDTRKIALVTLDGFSPSHAQLNRRTTQVWGAECDGVKSINFPGAAVGRRRIYTATHCKSRWALHFSLVNAAASDDLVHSIRTGYASCRANLAFLN